MTKKADLALVDDDPAVLDSLALYFSRNGIATLCFAGAESLLEMLDAGHDVDCIAMDVRMPGLNGIEALRRVLARASPPPVILITAHGDISMAVAAIKIGAFDFLEKPFDEGRLLEAYRRAFAETGPRRSLAQDIGERHRLYEALPPRQRQVLDMVAEGMTAKEIALKLELSPRTVEGHRGWGMQRLGARNIAELIRITRYDEARK